MARVAAPASSSAAPVDDAFAAYAQAGVQLVQQWLALQQDWFSTCCAMQSAWAKALEARVPAWPAGMAWPYGMEQLA